jgi:CheY-like chemotaxis protein
VGPPNWGGCGWAALLAPGAAAACGLMPRQVMMDKVLIVDGDRENLEFLEKGFSKLHQFKVRTIADGREALAALNRGNFAVLVTDLHTPAISGLELLAYMTQHHPGTPCIVMSEHGKPWFKKKMDQQSFLYHIEKPFELGALATAIFIGLNIKDEGIAIKKGMAMSSFLPLVEVEKKTCRIEVKSAGKGKGFLYFNEGVLIDAHFAELSGEQAALEMAGWNRIEIRFADLPKRRSTARRVKTDLMDMAGATWSRQASTPSAAATVAVDREIFDEVSNLLDDIDPAEAQAQPSPAAPAPANLVAAVQRHLSAIRGIKGFRALAVLNAAGSILLAEVADQGVDLERLAAAFNDVFNLAAETTPQEGLGECREMTFHTPMGVVLILDFADRGGEGRRLLALTDPEGNWYLLRSQLSEIDPGGGA